MTPVIAERCLPGDLWRLGRHRLLIGDCTDHFDVERLMGEERVPLVFTSPPYAHQRRYDGRAFDWTALMDGMAGALPLAPGGQLLVNLGLVHEKGEWAPYWEEWIARMRGTGWLRFGLYVWHQGEGLPGDWAGRLAPCFEFIFHFKRAGEARRRANKFIPCKRAGEHCTGTDIKLPSGRKRIKNAPVRSHKIPDSVIPIFREKRRGLPTAHPAVFPPALPALIMRAYSDEGETVYDPFVGSGTSFLAGEETGRRVAGMEVVSSYGDLALTRAEAAGMAVELLERLPQEPR